MARRARLPAQTGTAGAPVTPAVPVERVPLDRYPGYRRSAPERAEPEAQADGPGGPPRRRRVSEADRRAWQEWQQGRIEDAFADGQRAQAEGRALDALSAFERAHRLSPDDPVLMFALGLARSLCNDHAGCLALMERLGGRVDMREAWVTAASAALALGLNQRAGRHVERLLSTHGFDPSLSDILGRVMEATGRVGWCALSGGGPGGDPGGGGAVLNVLCAGPVQMIADGVAIPPGPPRRRALWRSHVLPEGWERWEALEVRDGAGTPLLGSPIAASRIARPAGFVEAAGPRHIRGWAWHPADRDRTPQILVRVASDRGDGEVVARLELDEAADPLPGNALARPRRIDFAVPRRLRGVSLDLTDAAGQSLFGSPLDPSLLSDLRPADRGAGGALPAAATAGGIDVVIPVYRHCRRTLDCIDSVVASRQRSGGRDVRIVVVEDSSPDADLRAALDALADDGVIELLRTPRNRGFTHTANLGLQHGAAAGRDVLLLNSDTLVAPDWLERMREAAATAGDIGSITPLSNDATILSYPDRRRANPMPDADALTALADQAARANGGELIDIPTGIGFCMYMRRACLDRVGGFDEALFAQGYGEENDWCLRAAALGWRHVAATGIVVAHEGGVSFGEARQFLMARNAAIVERLHPGYDAAVAAHIDADPLAMARRRIDRLRLLDSLAAEAAPATVALVTHDQGGGVERVVRSRVDALRAAGRAVLVLRPSSEGGVCVVSDGPADSHPNLAWRLPDETDALCDLLREAGVTAFEWHHMLGHEPPMRELPARLGVPFTITVHDYAAFCPRVTLVSYGRRYCGEPNLAACEACVATLGRRTDEAIGVAPLRARSAREFAAAARVVVPSQDVGRRIERHFPHARLSVEPWEEDHPELDLAAYARRFGAAVERVGAVPRAPGRMRVALLGGIGPEKGYDVLLDCLRCAREEGLPLEFVVAGFTPDDATLREAGCGPITGEYEAGELPALLAGFDADVAFLPSVCPETWSFTLSEAWRAGLPTVVFDIGTPAERVRATGRGLVLPIALPPSMICRQLMVCAQRSIQQRDSLAKTAVPPQFGHRSAATAHDSRTAAEAAKRPAASAAERTAADAAETTDGF